ncbi:hypothetical protein ODJ79_32370 [Actinoplanes sp. KI2]|uniref:AMIN-like domain-containing (lipo)protein n=1 Tax=Actinoplanes sp. KI2 TaxID=2983315 RepID=UPI0021D5D43F|nr:hypothetical protein [Actinoplanes sp. KI2]MCU7728430.1 hypothetical protein [Actinoplanes sp. KI2]
MKGISALIVLATLTVAGGCAGGPARTATPAPTGTPPASAAATPPVTEARQITATTTAPTGWATTPVTVRHEPPVPPVPVLSGIRYAAHPGFDRVVLDIPGPLPGYSAKYVPEVRSDGSGEPVSLPGKAFLLIVLNPAQAHRDDGTATVSGTHRTGLAGVEAYAVAGDYEGYVSIALGVNGVHNYHIGELSNRIYIDVAR